MKRRLFLKGLLALVAGLPAVVRGAGQTARLRYLRPPGALAGTQFLERCIRCNKCGEVCPNTAIRYMGMEQGLASWGTPYIVPREQACMLCMKCGVACPTGALKPIADDLTHIVAEVRMGTAVIDKSQCLSYQGKTCGVCYRACLLADVAMTIGFLEQPTVTEACVGCGLCERVCIQTPQAIRVYPHLPRQSRV